ncbi:MAG: preprotein translocase subunit SecA [Rickettsiales bacterium]|nr:preprotein translocase subunit SecA [Rickettsiales bacterium]
MFGFLLKRLFSTVNERYIKTYSKVVEEINSYEGKIQVLSDKDLKNQTNLLKKRIKQGESLDEILPEAFATVREVAHRILGQRHYDVQLLGGIVLHNKMIVEMKTGEGKTLTSTLPIYLNALEGKGVHIVTVNDYLAKRDAEWMGAIYKFLGLTVGYITNSSSEEERRNAYHSDITYSTNNELGFDYLRDNMRYSPDHFVQRPFNYAIIDEVDSILIDEARTPLVISGPAEDKLDLYYTIDKIIPKLVSKDYEIDEKSKNISLTDIGITHVEKLLEEMEVMEKGSSLFDIKNISVLHHINQALKAHHLFKNNIDYIVKDNQVMLIDEFTGRIMDGRRFSEGLHQALEAKENMPVQNETQTLASITFQNYFRLYPKLSGMTGTAATEASEFKDIYNLQVVSIPTKNPVIRVDENDIIYRTTEEKYRAIIKEIEEAYKKKQPILVGTISIENSEYISKCLKKKNIRHKVLNAKYHEKEAQIIAQAGQPKAVTIATNMAGRGTDIMLGGNPEMLAKSILDTSDLSKHEKEYKKIREQVKEDKEIALSAGGLLVIGTERHESRRIDNQLRGRSGRLGDPGRTIFYISLEDDLMRIFGSEKISSILKTLGLKKDEAIFHPMISKTIAKAQQKVEARNFEIRKNLLKFDDVMNDQRKIIYEQRNDIMTTSEVLQVVKDLCADLNKEYIDSCIKEEKFKEEWDVEGFTGKLMTAYGADFSIKDFIHKNDGIGMKEITEYLDKKSDKFIDDKIKTFGEEAFNTVARRILLVTIDQLWRDHLLVLDHLRHGIYLRAYGQKDPLNEYKQEAFTHFSTMLSNIKETYVSRISRVQITNIEDEEDLLEEPEQDLQVLRYDVAMSGVDEGNDAKGTIVNKEFDLKDPTSWGQIGRNEPCPCKSGKKYKRCHGQLKS